MKPIATSLATAVATAVATVLVASALAQGAPPSSAPKAFRIPVRHADPWLVKALLEGRQALAPEMSTVFAILGLPETTADGVNGLFRGRIVVNPTDNSLWFFPERPSGG
jgi:hypothetical protein